MEIVNSAQKTSSEDSYKVLNEEFTSTNRHDIINPNGCGFCHNSVQKIKERRPVVKDLCVWLTGAVMAAFAARYTYQIWSRTVSPRLSTWIIFQLGTGLSLATYAIAENRDFRSGILNATDTASVAVILLTIIVHGDSQSRFTLFEKFFLGGIGAIVAYGLFTGDAWSSNVLTQVLIGLGYIPTVVNLVTTKKNFESFTAWGFGLLAGIVGLYPAIADGNALAVVYSLRTVACISVVLIIMVYYETRAKKVP